MWLRNVQEAPSTSNKLCEHSAWPDFALTCENKLFHTGCTQVWCIDGIELDLFFMLNFWKRGNRSHSSRGWRAAANSGLDIFLFEFALLEKCRFRSVKIWLWTMLISDLLGTDISDWRLKLFVCCFPKENISLKYLHLCFETEGQTTPT